MGERTRLLRPFVENSLKHEFLRPSGGYHTYFARYQVKRETAVTTCDREVSDDQASPSEDG